MTIREVNNTVIYELTNHNIEHSINQVDKIIFITCRSVYGVFNLNFKDCVNCTVCVKVNGDLKISNLTKSVLYFSNSKRTITITDSDLSLININLDVVKIKQCEGVFSSYSIKTLEVNQSKNLEYFSQMNCETIKLHLYKSIEEINNSHITRLHITTAKKRTLCLSDINCPNLQSLSIYGNGKIILDSFDKLTSLGILLIKKTNVDINESMLKPGIASELYFEECVLNTKKISIDVIDLKKIILTRCGLEEIHLENYNLVKKLDIRFNEIRNIPLDFGIDIKGQLDNLKTRLDTGELSTKEYGKLVHEITSRSDEYMISAHGNPLEYPNGELYDHKKGNIYSYFEECKKQLADMKKKSAMK